MGNGIAQVAARAGYAVIMRDVTEGFLERGMAAIEKSLSRDVVKARLTASEKDSIVGRITTTTDFQSLHGASVVIEAVTESFAVKSEVFQALDRIANEDVILASNTSSISITKLAAVTRR